MDSTSVRVYAVDSVPSLSGELARYVWGLGAVYMPKFEVRPTFRLDRLGRGGDHGPFQRIGAPALRFTERLENYKRQHLPTDEFRVREFRIHREYRAAEPRDGCVARRRAAAAGQRAAGARYTERRPGLGSQVAGGSRALHRTKCSCARRRSRPTSA